MGGLIKKALLLFIFALCLAPAGPCRPACAGEDFVPASVRDISDSAYYPAVTALLDGAKESIVISMYDVTLGKDNNILRLIQNDLLEAMERGVRVTLYLNTNFSMESRKMFKNAILDRLHEVLVRALTQAPDAVGLLPLAAYDHDRNMGCHGVLGQLAGSLETIHAGHHHVHYNNLRPGLNRRFNGFFTVTCHNGFITMPFEHLAEYMLLGWRIINYKNQCHKI